MAETRKKQSRNRSIHETLRQIRLLAERADGDTFPTGLIDEVEGLVDEGKEKHIHRMLGEEELSEEVFTTIESCLHEAGYRLFGWLSTSGKRPEPVVLVPFALLFSIPIPIEWANFFPSTLPDTVKQAVEKNLFRRALALGRKPTVYFDDRLYPVDLTQWRKESITRRYLKSFFDFIEKRSRKPAPLTRAPRKASYGEIELGEVSIINRAICGVVAVHEEDAWKVEDRVFGEMKSDYVEQLIASIRDELESLDFHTEVEPSIFPQPVELWQVPEIGLQLERHLILSIETEVAMQRLLEMVEPGEPIAPVMYVSHHGKGQSLRELRLAAYSSESAEDPFFTYVWELVQELEQPEEVSEGILEVSRHLNARLVLLSGLLSNETCGDCGEKLFPGPGGMSHGVEE
jgi:hypothetical protein